MQKTYLTKGLLARCISIGEWTVLALSVAYLCGRTLPRSWRTLDTDFPNYYVTARLLREGYNTDRIYEWIWMQRQKDHMRILQSDQPVVAFIPHTPFSSLVVWPLTYWAPLTAKHLWTVCNILMLIAAGALLRSVTGLRWRHLVLLELLSFPVHRNLQYGQYYILLLVIFAAALWFYIRQERLLAGLVLGIGFGLKIFPLLFLLYFLRKKDLTAAAGLAVGAGFSVLASVAAFGLELNRIYFQQVLPWALRGEGANPYSLAANSISSLLHHAFIFEPEWNSHPLLHAPAFLAFMQPLLQILIAAPAILLVVPKDMQASQLRLEWSAYVIALLAVSTMPASYHFTLLILPIAIISEALLAKRRYVQLVLAVSLYLGIGFPLWPSILGTHLPFWVIPRLYLTIAFCGFSYYLLYQRQQYESQPAQGRRLWCGALVCGLALEIGASIQHLRNVSAPRVERLLTDQSVFLATQPISLDDHVVFTAMVADGYRGGELTEHGVSLSEQGVDQLAQSTAGNNHWIETSGRQSGIVVSRPGSSAPRLEVNNAEFPVSSTDGSWLAYLRSEHGRSRLWLRDIRANPIAEAPISPVGLNVFEMSFFPDNSVIFAAAPEHGRPHLFRVKRLDDPRLIVTAESRYPSASPDGRWLAYARRSGGVWNLWLRNMRTGEDQRVTDADCNDVSPSWETDSKTLLFASDCKRAFGLTALYRRRVLP